MGEKPLDERLPAQETDALSRALSGIIPGIALLAALSVAVYPFRDDLHSGTIALVLLVPVLVSAVGGVWAALGVAAVGAGTFNFFFTVPYHSFRIESSDSVAAFVIYIVVAVIVAVAASRRRDAVLLAGRRAHDARFLLASGEEIARSPDPLVSILDGLHGLRTVTRLKGIHLVAVSTPAWARSTKATGTIRPPGRPPSGSRRRLETVRSWRPGLPAAGRRPCRSGRPTTWWVRWASTRPAAAGRRRLPADRVVRPGAVAPLRRTPVSQATRPG